MRKLAVDIKIKRRLKSNLTSKGGTNRTTMIEREVKVYRERLSSKIDEYNCLMIDEFDAGRIETIPDIVIDADVIDLDGKFWSRNRIGENEASYESRNHLDLYNRLLCCRSELAYCKDDLKRFEKNIAKDSEMLATAAHIFDEEKDWHLKSYLLYLSNYYGQLSCKKENNNNFRAYKVNLFNVDQVCR
jgi:hypothetical protein